MVAYPKPSAVGIEFAVASISKSNPSTLASPKGRGPVQSAEGGPNAPYRKSAKLVAESSLAMKTSVVPPPRESKIFFPCDWQ